MATKLTLITGPSGSGKSAWCARYIDQARTDGLEVGGVLSRPVFAGERKVGIDLLDLQTGEGRRLANLRTPESKGLMTKRWQFDSHTLTWANMVLCNLSACDIVIIDELGPLEFSRDEGLLEGMRIVDDQRFPEMYIVIRPELLSRALKRWPWAEVLDVSKVSNTQDS
jgi:nucleoside-triphosphatase THEP1